MLTSLANDLPISTSISSLVTAGTGIITALSVLLGALTVFLPQMKKLNKGVAEVHGMVNQQRTDMIRYNQALIEALREAGIKIPKDQSIIVPPE